MSSSFHPPSRILMGPGPSNVDPRVLEALSRPTIGHLDPEFIGFMDSLKGLLQYAFKTKNALTLPVSAPGSAGMEACFVNLVEPGDTVIVCQNGVFGGRMKENVERCGASAVMVTDEWGKTIDLNKVKDALTTHPEATVLAFVHAETSTGATADAKALCQLAQEHDCLTIVDTVTSLGGIDVDVDNWGADAVYSGTQKCLSCVPGLSPVTFNDKAIQAIKSRKSKVQSWFLDMDLVMGYWGENQTRAYHHTAPINALYGLHEALVILKEEGLENSWARHRTNHLALTAGLEAMGLNMIVDSAHRLPQLNTVTIPAGANDSKVRRLLLEHYDLEIGAGLGSLAGMVWRIGLMGFASNQKNVLTCLGALEGTLLNEGAVINTDVAIGAANQVYGN